MKSPANIPQINFLALIEMLILGSAAFLALLPLQQLFMVPFAGGALNTFETSYLLILFFSVLCTLYYFSLRTSRPFLYLLLAIGGYTTFQLLLDSGSLFYIVRQLRYFMPFIVAVVVLAVRPKRLYLKETLYYLSVAAMLSALASLVLHFFFQETLIRIIQRSSDPAAGNHLALLIRSGRSPWGNASLVYITVIALGFLQEYTPRRQLIVKLAVG
ncbi:MAG: hypothetical protein AAF564_09845, partial [Bacteroidota bacterium]